jgi:hypothetical protein
MGLRQTYLDSNQFIDIYSSRPALKSAPLTPAAAWITTATIPSSALAMPLITLMATSGTPIIVSIILFVVTARIIAIVTVRRRWLRSLQPLLRTIYHILDSCYVDTNLEFPISWVFARGRFDEV